MPLAPYLSSLADLTEPTRQAAERLEAEWAPDSPPEITAAASLASAFATAITALSTYDIESVGQRVEALLTSEDESASNAIATGFLESLLAHASGDRLDFRKIAWMLGPESLKYCREWDTFTSVKMDGIW